MIQNHLLQVVVAAGDGAADAARPRRHAQRAGRRAEVDAPARRRATSCAASSTATARSKGVATDSTVETFAALRLYIDNWRWAGVPFFIRAGKCMPMTTTEVVVDAVQAAARHLRHLRPQPRRHHPLPPEPRRVHRPRSRGPRCPARPWWARTSSSSRGTRRATDAKPYERLLHDAIDGEMTLFARQDEVEEAWRVVDPILDDAMPRPSLPAAAPTDRRRPTSSSPTSAAGARCPCRADRRGAGMSRRSRDSSAWKALEAHYDAVKDVHLRELFADDPDAGRAPDGRGGRHLSRLLEEPRHRRDAAAPCRAGRGLRPARPHRRHVPRRANQRHRGPRRAPRRAAGPAR